MKGKSESNPISPSLSSMAKRQRRKYNETAFRPHVLSSHSRSLQATLCFHCMMGPGLGTGPRTATHCRAEGRSALEWREDDCDCWCWRGGGGRGRSLARSLTAPACLPARRRRRHRASLTLASSSIALPLLSSTPKLSLSLSLSLSLPQFLSHSSSCCMQRID